jgi:gluconokinase
LADITGKKLVVVQSEDASAIGAAFIAMKASGLTVQYPTTLSDAQLYTPNLANAAVYSRNFAVYKQLYIDLKATMHGE